MNKKILHWPNPKLRKKSKDILPDSVAEYGQLVQDLIDTCNVAMGAGLAANQIGSPVSAFVIQPKVFNEHNPDPCDINSDFMVCFNPVWKPTMTDSGQREVEDWTEGCLSLPGLDMKVCRSRSGSLSYLDQYGEMKTIQVNFPLAAAIEHEIDHLQGKTIAHVGRKNQAAVLTLSFWRKKREKMARKAK